MSALPSLRTVSEALPRMVGRLDLRRPVLPDALARRMPRIVAGLDSVPAARRLASRLLINHYGYATTLRPRALSMASDYTTWTSLTDRRFTGRHLPPADPETIAQWPAEADVNALYRREHETKSTDTSVMVHVLRPVVHRQLPADQPRPTFARTRPTTRSTCARSTGSAQDQTRHVALA